MSHSSATSLAKEFSPQRLTVMLRRIAPTFRPAYPHEPLDAFIQEGQPFDSAQRLGVIEFPSAETLLVASVHVREKLTARSGRRQQYELAKRILKAENHNAAIFAFYDDERRFRLSLVTVAYHGTRREFSTYRRYTFFVAPDLPNKTFLQQFQRADFSTLEKIQATFSLEAISDEFYREFKPRFDTLAQSVQGTEDDALRQDFTLLFVIRTIFLGFVQKKGWLGESPRFLQQFWREYRDSGDEGDFYRAWLEPLFFEALNSPPGRLVAYGHAPFSKATQRHLQMAPYLNGELFKRKRGLDDQGLSIPDAHIGEFFDFLFQYNFTVEENELYDEELELNPEFLGIIFERLTNMDQGAVYTPRVEVDLMCRLALVKWLERSTAIAQESLYHLFFHRADGETEAAPLSAPEIRTLIQRLESVTVCDPAAGSGAFEVGMLQVLAQTLEDLYNRAETPADLKTQQPSAFKRKKDIIARSLYGVEVKRWAVWINHLRLWLSLFVDMPDSDQLSLNPLLPNLTFKVRTGDSLVQRIGSRAFPVHGHANLTSAIKRKVTQLKKKKRDFFYNRSNDYRAIEKEELDVFRAIIDAEIEERQREIAALQAPQAENKTFFIQPTERKDQERARQKRLAQLQAEIADLQAQKRTLQEDRPFIWSLEFAEIFFDRGGFDVIIGNPPYVRKESITDPRGKLPPKEYKQALLEMVLLDFPGYFAKSKSQADRFKKGRKPSGHSDLYTYFYIRSLRLLNPQGAHVFICSNSWLDVGYGAWLQEFFLRHAPLYLVIDNHARRSFARADVNTIITVSGAPYEKELALADEATLVQRFVAFKKPFEEAVHAEAMLAIERATRVLKSDDYRVYPITVAELLREGSEPSASGAKYVGDKWGGKYLRAPDIAQKIFTSKKNTIRLRDVAQILGYVHDNNVGMKYPLTPFIRSIRDTRTILITPSIARMYGVNQRGNSLIKADLLFPRTFNDVHIVLWNKGRFAIGKEFYRIIAREVKPRTLALLLNSTLSVLQRELLGLHNLGGGAIKFSGNDVGLFVIPTGIDEERLQGTAFDQFLKREIHSIFTECGIDPHSEIPIAAQEPHPLPDRQKLDAIIFDALGLSEEERKEVYRAVCQLVWDRLHKAQT